MFLIDCLISHASFDYNQPLTVTQWLNPAMIESTDSTGDPVYPPAPPSPNPLHYHPPPPPLPIATPLPPTTGINTLVVCRFLDAHCFIYNKRCLSCVPKVYLNSMQGGREAEGGYHLLKHSLECLTTIACHNSPTRRTNI